MRCVAPKPMRKATAGRGESSAGVAEDKTGEDAESDGSSGDEGESEGEGRPVKMVEVGRRRGLWWPRVILSWVHIQVRDAEGAEGRRGRGEGQGVSGAVQTNADSLRE